jgi:L,D-peptidoglycan transpeptidase YkuD (ErfK/YbiS/YcfS/YnhG family)
MWKLGPCAALAAAAALVAPVAQAQTCPQPIKGALRLVMVTAPSMDTMSARMQLFTRAAADQPWSKASEPEPTVLGKSGLAWGYPFLQSKREGELEKVEGDKRTPAGFYRIGSSFGFSAADRPDHVVLKAGETVCVEDPASPYYNSITTRAKIGPNVKADDMRRTTLYRNGLFVDYPSDRMTRRGSCIFLHIWRSPSDGTAGCVAMPEPRVKALQEFARAGAVLAVLSEGALDRFPGCLPDAVPKGKASPSKG